MRPALEIGILFVFIYGGLYFLRGTRGTNVLAGLVVAVLLLTLVTDFLKFDVLSRILNGLWAVFAMALIIIFQPELRRAFSLLGRSPFVREMQKNEAINEVVAAVINLANQRIGAIILFERRIGMRTLAANAIQLDAYLSHHMIQSIFHPASPLHDGGIIIKNNKILAARVIFPLSQNQYFHSLGTRHRAAIGITEETDAVAVVVSEETGMISIACGGNIKRGISPDKLLRFLRALLVSVWNEPLKDIFEIVTGNDNQLEGFSRSSLDDE